MVSVLRKKVGWHWPIIVFKALRKKNGILKKTRWKDGKTLEEKFVQRLSIACAVYEQLQDGFPKEDAFNAMREIIVPIGTQEQISHYSTITESFENPLDRLRAFHSHMDKEGNLRFNKREYVENNNHICHFHVTRCVFHDFFTEVGMPELTRLFCEVDDEFFSTAYPDIKFHRGQDENNTIAYGKQRCNFIFEL